MLKRILLISIFIPALVLGQSIPVEFTPEEQEWIENHPVVYYGFDPAWKPIEFEENGEHVGITRDYVNILSERIGFELKAHPDADSWEKAMDLFKAEELLVLTAVGDNAERREYMNFTQANQIHAWVIVTKKDGDFIGSVEDLNGRVVATPKGYFITNLLEQEKLDIKFHYTASVEESLMAITTGEAEATISNLAVISHYLNYSGFENLKIAAPAAYPDMETKMGVVKSEPLLHSILDKGLSSITSKEKNEIVQNWVSVQFEHGVNMAKVWTIAGISIGVVGLIFGFFVYWNRKLKKEVSRRKEAEEQLQVSFDEISMQKILIEEKNHEVMDSIVYAKRLQEAILPPVELINETIPNNFVLYLPKDIVAGDFYWMEKATDKAGNDMIFIAAADCTGHGVPGAMVSVVCSNALNRSVMEYGIVDPGEILDKTTDLVIERFSRADEEVKDGMDIALSSIEYLDDNRAKIEYAGAHNHLWIITTRADIGVETNITKEEDFEYYLHEIKANKQPVGQYFDRKPFETKKIILNKGERFYLYSDGFADQFGGENGKKFKNKSFKTLLLSTMNKSIMLQKEKLEETFENWKSDFEQLDDVCVIGVEI